MKKSARQRAIRIAQGKLEDARGYLRQSERLAVYDPDERIRRMWREQATKARESITYWTQHLARARGQEVRS